MTAVSQSCAPGAAFVALLLGLLMAQIWLAGPLPGFDIPGPR